MLLAVDMGNTHIEMGLVDGDDIILSERMSTDHNKTELEYAIIVSSLLEMRGIDKSAISGSIISSVVPDLTYILKKAIKKAVGITPLVVGPGVRNGLKIFIDDPKELGADMAVAAVGAKELYGAPLIIIDMGTATTISSIDEDGAFRGGVIIPGVNVSLNALVSDTSQLPRISLGAPKKTIGTNTVDCMLSGIVLGQASMLDGMIERFKKEMTGEPKLIATGGLSGVIVPHCEHEVIIDNALMIKGLQVIYEMNRQ